MTQSVVQAELASPVRRVWEVLTDLNHQDWRSDIERVEVTGETTFVEYTKGGVATFFTVSTPFKNVIFRRNRMSFFAGQHTGVYSLNYRPTCRLEARQVLIYQCILDLTGENDKYNYSKAAHLYPLLSYSPCSAKNYKIASALTHCNPARATGLLGLRYGK